MASQLPVRLADSLTDWPLCPFLLGTSALTTFPTCPCFLHSSPTLPFLRKTTSSDTSLRPFIFQHDRVVQSDPPVKTRGGLVTAHCSDYFKRTISLSCCSGTLVFAMLLFRFFRLANVYPSSSRFEPVVVCARLSPSERGRVVRWYVWYVGMYRRFGRI